MTGFCDNELTCDAFLGGSLHLYQPRHGYRAGVDPVLLASSVPAQAGQSVLELGCGVGAAILCLGARVPALRLTGIEREPAFAELALRNGGDALEVVTADLREMPLHLRQRQFDHVLANPPYFDRAASVASDDPARESAHGEDTPLAQWVKTASKRLAPKGQAHFIHRVERLPDLLRAMPHDLGSVEVLPLTARAGRDPDRVIVRARKNGRAAFRLHAAKIMHEGAHHDQDGKRYTPEIDDVLRNGAALRF
ncbi:tRNA1(Val) (adenine(37)-N6)-methyltransferase [Sulfitobacter mediterraneus]|uniref:Methyltransferase n=1 Tax=Sulfitobacter mediterraneus TaxID=83219 RepID=A0A061SN05_9RHOB|nr:methyltransferase domain-containing protein [Sulfitobacter mediterraneus]KAJ02207.1 methyltransferase [Sulfitobacter mediterraneus]